jgi:hypothetical protein
MQARQLVQRQPTTYVREYVQCIGRFSTQTPHHDYQVVETDAGDDTKLCVARKFNDHLDIRSVGNDKGVELKRQDPGLCVKFAGNEHEGANSTQTTGLGVWSP